MIRGIAGVFLALLAACPVAGASTQVVKGPHGDLYLPERVPAETPKVLAIHGGGWRAYDRSSFASVLPMAPCAFAVFGGLAGSVDPFVGTSVKGHVIPKVGCTSEREVAR